LKTYTSGAPQRGRFEGSRATKIASKEGVEGPNNDAYIYIIRFKTGGRYIGAIHDLGKRVAEHFSRERSRTTNLDSPIELVYSEKYKPYSEARTLENQIKRWSRGKKEALVAGDEEKLHQLSIPHGK
jgi:predicted GIY-YIG superfamily endonuclease